MECEATARSLKQAGWCWCRSEELVALHVLAMYTETGARACQAAKYYRGSDGSLFDGALRPQHN